MSLNYQNANALMDCIEYALQIAKDEFGENSLEPVELYSRLKTYIISAEVVLKDEKKAQFSKDFQFTDIAGDEHNFMEVWNTVLHQGMTKRGTVTFHGGKFSLM